MESLITSSSEACSSPKANNQPRQHSQLTSNILAVGFRFHPPAPVRKAENTFCLSSGAKGGEHILSEPKPAPSLEPSLFGSLASSDWASAFLPPPPPPLSASPPAFRQPVAAPKSKAHRIEAQPPKPFPPRPEKMSSSSDRSVDVVATACATRVTTSSPRGFTFASAQAGQLNLLQMGVNQEQDASRVEEIRTAPLFSTQVGEYVRAESGWASLCFPQFGLLAGVLDTIQPSSADDLALDKLSIEPSPPKDEPVPSVLGLHSSAKGRRSPSKDARQGSRKIITPTSRRKIQDAGSLNDPRLFLNVSAPWSIFICGSQGSGKSHSLSCILENCLLASPQLGLLPNPLAGLVFHYDSFSSTMGGQVCEAAHLCSAGIEVTVLVSPSNYSRMKELYGNLPGLSKGAPRPRVEPLRIDQQYLNAERLMTLMAAESGGNSPLYMQSLLQVLREMAMIEQNSKTFDYQAFKAKLLAKDLTQAQITPLTLRLEILESFIAPGIAPAEGSMKRKKAATTGIAMGNNWTPKRNAMTIVDLSCPFVNSETACVLFDMCLGIFLEQKMDIGRIVALDEAHKVWT